MFIKCSIGVKKNKENTRFLIFFLQWPFACLKKNNKMHYDDFFLHHPFWRQGHVLFKRFHFLPHSLTHGLENSPNLEKKRSKSHLGEQLLKISRLVSGRRGEWRLPRFIISKQDLSSTCPEKQVWSRKKSWLRSFVRTFSNNLQQDVLFEIARQNKSWDLTLIRYE